MCICIIMPCVFVIDAPDRALGVKVINVTTSHSLFIVQAHVIQEVGHERPHNGEMVTVLFDEDIFKILKLQAGSFVLICPPRYACMHVCRYPLHVMCVVYAVVYMCMYI